MLGNAMKAGDTSGTTSKWKEDKGDDHYQPKINRFVRLVARIDSTRSPVKNGLK